MITAENDIVGVRLLRNCAYPIKKWQILFLRSKTEETMAVLVKRCFAGFYGCFCFILGCFKALRIEYLQNTCD